MNREKALDLAVFLLAIAGALLPMVRPLASPSCLAPMAHRVIGSSMMPTLALDDVIHTCGIDTGNIERGDLVIFDKARNSRQIKRVKRVIGLPGDTIRVAGGSVVINGDRVSRRRLADVTIIGAEAVNQYEETLPNGAAYRILDMTREGRRDTTPVITVPAGFCYVMGDHRDVSLDSRAPRFGLVSLAAVKAKVRSRERGLAIPPTAFRNPHKHVPAAAGSS